MMERGAVTFGETTIAYQILRSNRRKKTVEIALDHGEGVLVAAPLDTPAQRIAEVVRKRAGWIIRTANGSVLHPSPKAFVSGESFPYLGRQVRLFIEPAQVRRVSIAFTHWRFVVTVPHSLPHDIRQTVIARAIERWYYRRATVRLIDRVARWVPEIGRQPRKVLIRNQRQRWASCSPDGILRFNWRIIQLEPSLIDYVVVHELAHLLVRTHSAPFWHHIARILPDYRLRRQRLKEAGPSIVL